MLECILGRWSGAPAVARERDAQCLEGKVPICQAFSKKHLLCYYLQGVTRLALHPTQPLIFTGCLDGCVRCWDLRTGTCLRTFQGHADAVQDLAVSPDGSFIISGSEDGTARVFSMLQHEGA